MDLLENTVHTDKHPIQSFIYEWIDAAVVSLIAVVFLFTFIFSIVGISGTSMLNTLQNNDIVILSRLFYEPKYGDIVVISRNYTNDEKMIIDNENKPIIKRVIATEGQKVDIKNGKAWVDGVPLDEAAYTRTDTQITEDVKFPVTVPKGCIFVMGDNRADSHDSRSTEIGMVDKRFVLGEAIVRVFPFDQFKNLDTVK
ncbi:MAG: signal peptidase I [Clostridiales bacterium 43-6]|nr:MAG: signal peptidase I [Clostridiales bacterium 43-6]